MTAHYAPRNLALVGLAVAAQWQGREAVAQPPEAGTLIQSSGTLTYANERLGLVETLPINTVTTIVSAVPSFDISTVEQVVRSPGERAASTFQVTNTGNVDTGVQLDFGELTGDYRFTNLDARVDLNGNGIIDPGEPTLGDGTLVDLPFGATVFVLVDAQLPIAVAPGDASALVLEGRLSDGSGNQVASTANVVVASDALSLENEGRVNEDNERILYTLTLRNNAPTPFDASDPDVGLPVTVDRVAQNLIIVRDDVPLNTTFSEVVDSSMLDPIFQLNGAADTEWTASVPDDLSEIRSVGFATDRSIMGGQTLDLQFLVTVNDGAGQAEIENTGLILAPDAETGIRQTPSNSVRTAVDGSPSALRFYGVDDFNRPVDQADFNEDLYLEVSSGSCNVTAGIDQAEITVRTSPHGDEEVVVAVETAPNSGVFRSEALRTGDTVPVLVGDGVLTGGRRSAVSATVDCDQSLRQSLTLAPAGVVFAAATNEPIPGALVELLAEDGRVLETTTADEDGMFTVTPGIAGIVTLRVTPPGNMVAPSARLNFPGYGRTVDPAGSYALPFRVSEAGRTLTIDVPVDPNFTGTLVAEKTADKPTASLGEFIRYTVSARNTSSIAVANAEIADTLPPGLSFIEGSALLNEAPLSDPERLPGGALSFDLAALAPNEEVTLSYTAKVLPTAGEGDATNIALARGTLAGFGQEVTSNVAQATVDIDNDDGVFSRDGVILGKVFLDCNGDGIQSNLTGLEPGIPGVQLHTQEGLSVATDGEGRFSLPGLKPTTHILDVYEPTLPDGTHVVVTRTMDAGDGGSRFVPLKAGEIRSEDFAVQPVTGEACSEEVVEHLRVRIADHAQRGLGQPADISTLQLSRVRPSVLVDASESVETAVFRDRGRALAEGGINDDNPPRRINPETDLETLIETADPTLQFLDLKDGDQLVQRRVSIRVSAPADMGITLTRNGAPVAADRLGRKVSNAQVQLAEFVAVELRPGMNTFVLAATDSFGNVREERAITVSAPGNAARVRVVAPETAMADPTRPVPIELIVVDDKGHPTAAPIEATLYAQGEDRFDARDTSDQQIGLQTIISDGRTRVDLIPADQVGTRTITVETPFGRTETRIRFTTNTASDPIAVGIVEGAIGLGSGGSDTIRSVLEEDELNQFEDTEEGLEAAIYARGKIAGDALLTIRVDTDKDPDDDLFRSVEPDEFYPVYGDQSERGFDARSRGKVFARIEKDASYLMFGDVIYDSASTAVQLGNYQRTLEGAEAHFEAGRLRLDVYGGETDTGQTVLELPARGISGPYELGFGDVVENSERVEIITRDRNQPDVILKTEPVSRFTGYTLDYFARTVIFTRPVPARDENLNPQSIRITFETDEGLGEKYAVYGGEAGFDLTEWLSVGARELRSEGPEDTADDRAVRTAYVDAAIGETGRFQVEAAETDGTASDGGRAVRLSYEQQTATGSVGARIASSDKGFDAPGAGVNAGRREARLYGNTRLENSGAVVTGEALYSEDSQTGAERYGVVGRYEQAVSDTLRVRGGSRYISDSTASGQEEDALTAIVGLNWTPAALSGASFDLEGEREVTDGDATRVGLGADYALNPKWRLYSLGEWTSSRSGGFGLVEGRDDITLRTGSEYRWSENVNAFTEYRADSDFFDAGVAQGLTSSWALAPSLSARARVEHVQPIADTYDRNTAVGIGATWETEERNRLLDGDLEFAAGENNRENWYTSAAAGVRGDTMTVLARSRTAFVRGGINDRTLSRTRIGWAHRPVENDVSNSLAWYEFEFEDTGTDRISRHIWSVGSERKHTDQLRLRGRVAGQFYRFNGPVVDEDTTTVLAQLGFDRDIATRWNFAAHVAGLADGGFYNRYYGVGAEINLVAAENAMIGLGYNYTRLKEERIRQLYRTGLYMRLRVKFDQDVWDIFGGQD